MKRLLKSFDHIIELYLTRWPRSLAGLMHLVSYIGQPLYTIGILLLIGSGGLLAHNYSLVTAATVAGVTFICNSVLKIIFHRARPINEYVRGMALETYSFPSGHAASGIVVFGLLADAAFHLLAQPYGAIVAGLLAVFIVVTGISRVYLGAHHPSDVLVGWLVGSVGLAVIVLFVQPFA